MKLKKGMLLASLLIFTLFVLPISKTTHSSPDQDILSDTKAIIVGKEFTSQQSDQFLSYINSREEHDSQYYFISGFLYYMTGDHKLAAEQFSLAKEQLTSHDPDFIRIYTYVLLNESLQIQGKTTDLPKNCKAALSNMSVSKEYKNDTDLCWRIVSVLTHHSSDISLGSRLLSSYTEQTRGLTRETIIKLYGNIGQLSFLADDYPSALYYYWNGIDLLDTSPKIPGHNNYKAKFFAVIADIAYSLGQYQTAVDYYDQALEISALCDKSKEMASVDCLALINKSASHLA